MRRVPGHILILAEILVLVGGVILPAVPASTRISARLKRVQGHSSPVNVLGIVTGTLYAVARLHAQHNPLSGERGDLCCFYVWSRMI